MDQHTQDIRGRDDEMRALIIEGLRNDPGIDATKIEVEVREGTVLLKGLADTEKEKERSASIAATIPGVRNVENHLHIEVGLVHALSSLAARIQKDIIDDADNPDKK